MSPTSHGKTALRHRRRGRASAAPRRSSSPAAARTSPSTTSREREAPSPSPRASRRWAARRRGIQADVTGAPRLTPPSGARRREFGRIDILVNNAGDLIGRASARPTCTEEFYPTVMDVNVLTTILCRQAVAPA